MDKPMPENFNNVSNSDVSVAEDVNLPIGNRTRCIPPLMHPPADNFAPFPQEVDNTIKDDDDGFWAKLNWAIASYLRKHAD
ncbi:MAG: hypothetical protein LBE50_06105 [Gallionellaceae bacterium]|jgi:hypothetical protein|nr:hypothetical protein [Gallionellaceae bacterium]